MPSEWKGVEMMEVIATEQQIEHAFTFLYTLAARQQGINETYTATKKSREAKKDEEKIKCSI